MVPTEMKSTTHWPTLLLLYIKRSNIRRSCSLWEIGTSTNYHARQRTLGPTPPVVYRIIAVGEIFLEVFSCSSSWSARCQPRAQPHQEVLLATFRLGTQIVFSHGFPEGSVVALPYQVYWIMLLPAMFTLLDLAFRGERLGATTEFAITSSGLLHRGQGVRVPLGIVMTTTPASMYFSSTLQVSHLAAQ